MGKVQLFEIRLGDSRVVYSPGEPLAGTVTVRLSGSLQYRAIKVSCIGSCGVSNKINDTAWTVEEQYFNSTLSLADKGTVHKGLVQICAQRIFTEMYHQDFSINVKYPSQAALACAQRMGARIRDYKSLGGAVQARILSRTWQPPCKHC
nr:arrestin domain-containing protein 1 [Taeniopygia guttata]